MSAKILMPSFSHKDRAIYITISTEKLKRKGKRGNPEKHHFLWWAWVIERSRHELGFGCWHSAIGEQNFSGTPFSDRQHHKSPPTTELNAAFKSRETKIVGLRNMCLCSRNCRRVNISSTQLRPGWNRHGSRTYTFHVQKAIEKGHYLRPVWIQYLPK